jgi:hypothetical protein
MDLHDLEIIKIPTTQQTLEIDDFWYYMTVAESSIQERRRMLRRRWIDPRRLLPDRSESRNSDSGIDYNIVLPLALTELTTRPAFPEHVPS